MTAWRSKLTDKAIDRVLEIAAGMAEDWYRADDDGYGYWPDRSWCPYLRRGLPGADPNGTCGFGCIDEPACHTDGPPPLAELYDLLAPAGVFGTEEDG